MNEYVNVSIFLHGVTENLFSTPSREYIQIPSLFLVLSD